MQWQQKNSFYFNEYLENRDFIKSKILYNVPSKQNIQRVSR
jgi:hypothetical protein